MTRRTPVGAVISAVLLVAAAWGADTGVPPRPKGGEYLVHGNANATVIAAAIIPSDQVSKMFSSDLAKRYVVVEVAIYPGQGSPFDVRSSDFSLQVGRQIGYADRPTDVSPWPENPDTPARLTDVTSETGVSYEQSKDPVYGRRQTVGTYSSVAVTDNGPGQTGPPAGPDPQAVYDRIQRKSLSEGETRTAIAGYLYFPQYVKPGKKDPIELNYSRGDVSVSLVFPREQHR